MAAQKILVIDAPIYLAVDAEADPEEVAAEFDSGFSVSIQPFEFHGPGNPEILSARVNQIRIATKDEIDAVGIDLEGDEDE